MRKGSTALLLMLVIWTGACHYRPMTGSALSSVPAAPESASPAKSASLPNDDVRYRIQSVFDTSPEFGNTWLQVQVTDTEVTVSGYVIDRAAHVNVISFAQSNADGREVIDRVLEGGFPGRDPDR